MKVKGTLYRVCIATLVIACCGAVLILTTASGQQQSQTWPQWAQNPQHTGFLNVTGQDLNKILANIVYDPLVRPSRR